MSPQPEIEVEDSLEDINEYYLENQWGDGLPIVPPTEERVTRMLDHTDHDPEDVIGVLPPVRGQATVQKIAVNAVMAGCRPPDLPALIATVDALCEEKFNLYGMQATTNPVGVMMFFNGPVVDQLDVNYDYNCLGQGHRANATLGRAVRLIMMNIGGAKPGETDRATHGFPGKYSFCFAENETENPWEPFHVERGFDEQTSTVTVVGASGTQNMLEPTDDADDMLRVFAASIPFPTSNDYILVGEPFLILSWEHAEVLAEAGFSKQDIKEYLWEETRIPGRAFSSKCFEYAVSSCWESEFETIDEDTRIPIARAPESIQILVAGGPSIHSVYVPTFGDARCVTKPIPG